MLGSDIHEKKRFSMLHLVGPLGVITRNFQSIIHLLQNCSRGN